MDIYSLSLIIAVQYVQKQKIQIFFVHRENKTVFKQLEWLTFQKRIINLRGVSMHKCVDSIIVPSYLCQLLKQNKNVNARYFLYSNYEF